MLEPLIAAAEYLSHGINLAYLLLGVGVGIAFGSIPGLGGATAIALLLPLTFGMDAIPAMIMITCIYYGSKYGGSTTSILIRLS